MTIHLHWLYFRGPRIATRNLRRGYSLCSVYCEPEQMTTFIKDVTCTQCQDLYAEYQDLYQSRGQTENEQT